MLAKFMPAYYRASFQDFARVSQSEIEATLAGQNAKAAFPLQPEALFAWKAQLPEFKNAVCWLLREVPDANLWSILLEYPIPRVGKRIDAVILAARCDHRCRGQDRCRAHIRSQAGRRLRAEPCVLP